MWPTWLSCPYSCSYGMLYPLSNSQLLSFLFTNDYKHITRYIHIYVYVYCNILSVVVPIVTSSIWNNGDPLILKHVQVWCQQPGVAIKVQQLLQEKCKLPWKFQSIWLTNSNLSIKRKHHLAYDNMTTSLPRFKILVTNSDCGQNSNSKKFFLLNFTL